jgi:hypothetical protein
MLHIISLLIFLIFLIFYQRESFVNYQNLEKVNNNKLPCSLTVYRKNNKPIFLINKNHDVYDVNQIDKLIKDNNCNKRNLINKNIDSNKNNIELSNYLEECNKQNAVLKYNLLKCQKIKNKGNFCRKIHKKKIPFIESCLSKKLINEFPNLLKKDEYGLN